MKLRLPLLFLAFAVPVAAAIVIARFALPAMVQAPAKNSTAIVALPQESPRKVPEKLEEAKQLAVDRLLHLQKLSQAEWASERQTIMYKFPPEKIEDAIARAQKRIADLNQMTQQQWATQREDILKKENLRLANSKKK